MLDIPDVRIRESDPWYACGPTVARAVLAFHGLPLTFADRLIPDPNKGTPPDELRTAFYLAGALVAEGRWTIASVAALARAGVPLIAYVNDSTGFDHYVVVRGLGRGRVYYHCPVAGRRSQPLEEFMSRWHSVGKGGKPVRCGAMAISIGS